MLNYQLQERRGSLGIYIATADSDDLRFLHIAALQAALQGRNEQRIVNTAAEAKVLRKYAPAYVGGYAVTVKEGRREDTLSAETIGAMSC